MKKIFATVLAASMMLLGANAFAQVTVGAGYVNSTLASKAGNTKTTTPANGFYAGASFNIPVSGAFGVAPGVTYEFLASSKESSFAGIASAKGTTTEHYVGIPIMLNYNLALANDLSIVPFLGPTIQCGLASNTKLEGAIAGAGASTKVDNYGDKSTYGRFDVLLGGGVAFDFNALEVKVAYNYGMLNRYTGEGDASTHRSEVTLGFGYKF